MKSWNVKNAINQNFSPKLSTLFWFDAPKLLFELISANFVLVSAFLHHLKTSIICTHPFLSDFPLSLPINGRQTSKEKGMLMTERTGGWRKQLKGTADGWRGVKRDEEGAAAVLLFSQLLGVVGWGFGDPRNIAHLTPWPKSVLTGFISTRY